MTSFPLHQHPSDCGTHPVVWSRVGAMQGSPPLCAILLVCEGWSSRQCCFRTWQWWLCCALHVLHPLCSALRLVKARYHWWCGNDWLLQQRYASNPQNIPSLSAQ